MISEAIEKLGGVTEAANALGVSRQAVNDWRLGKYKPGVDHYLKLIYCALGKEKTLLLIERQLEKIQNERDFK